MKKLIVGNWKMNCSLQDAKALTADVLNTIYGNSDLLESCEFVVCPPNLFIPTVRHAITTVDLMTYGAQDCSVHDNGAYTGDTSAEMLKDSGCEWVIVGHSERRTHQNETNATVAKKAKKCHASGMTAIICVGETEEDRKSGNHLDVVGKQLEDSIPKGATAENTVIAYEPVWAIGTGNHARSADIEEMHKHIRDVLSKDYKDGADMRILYGGSVKPDNAGEVFGTANVDGALIGGASLDAESFLAIAREAS